jgi:hypothetical protein
MPLPMLAALVVASALMPQESVVPPAPRVPLPRPVADAPMVHVNDNRRPAGNLSGGTLTLSLDIVEAACQPEGAHDPVVRVLAFAEPGKEPQVPGPLLRAPVGTVVRLTLRNRSDSAVMMGGLRRSMPADRDTVQIAAGATREVAFRLDRVGNERPVPDRVSVGDRPMHRGPPASVCLTGEAWERCYSTLTPAQGAVPRHRDPSVDVVVGGSSWFLLGCCDGDGMFGFARRSSVPYTSRAGMKLPTAGARFG